MVKNINVAFGKQENPSKKNDPNDDTMWGLKEEAVSGLGMWQSMHSSWDGVTFGLKGLF